MTMKMLCLCPTYGRPRHLIENTLACFESQTHEHRFLIILDDLGNIGHQAGKNWVIISDSHRFPHLPAKYHEMLGLAESYYPMWNVVVPWDDDDLYLSRHLEAHATTISSTVRYTPNSWSHPSKVWSTYTGQPEIEKSGGRFYASCAVWRELLESMNGWRQTHQADFDQWFLRDAGARGFPGDPLDLGYPPTFVFRWADTGAPHAQGVIEAPNDIAWYRRIKPAFTGPMPNLEPRFDEAAVKVRTELGDGA